MIIEQIDEKIKKIIDAGGKPEIVFLGKKTAQALNDECDKRFKSYNDPQCPIHNNLYRGAKVFVMGTILDHIDVGPA